VVATSDDRGNSLVVSAPDDLITTIDELVKAIDVPVEDVTEVRVFRLKYADPVEMADLLAGLFPDDTRSDSSGRGSVRFGGGPFGGRSQGSSAQQSDRMKKIGRVLAVADQRTASVVVSASHELMVQIAAMIEQLDANPAKKQKVYVYSVENADVQEVEQLLRDMFDRSGTMNNRNTANQENALSTRATQQLQQNSTGIGTTIGGNRAVGGSSGLSGSSF
jgi:type II secretory pathway component GspD/PulD (secretin)